MPQYRYRAISMTGSAVDGQIEADTGALAREQLQAQGLVVQSLREVSDNQYAWWNTLSFHVSINEITFFTKNFAVMLNAGLTVVEALIIAESQATGKLKVILHRTLQNVETGHSLADSLQKYRRYFPGIYVEVIRTGELSGNLARNLQQLSDQLENDLNLRRKIQAALIYPAIVVVAVIGLGVILSVFVFPRLNHLFESLNVELPLTTQLLLIVSNFFTNYWLAVLLALIGLAIVGRLLLFISVFQSLADRFLLRLPIAGSIVRNVNLTRFSGTLGSLLASGVPIAESIGSVIHSTSNSVYRQAFQAALEHVEHGGTLSSFLARSPRLFPKTVSRMIAVGEHTGRLDAMLTYLSRYYDGEVESATKQLSVTLEPILLLAIGVVVAFVGISVITPIYQFTASVGKL